MSDVLLSQAEGEPIPLHLVAEAELEAFLAGQPPLVARMAALSDFKAKAGQVLAVPGETNGKGLAVFGLGAKARADGMAFRALPAKLPAGDYRIIAAPEGVALETIALAWALGAYGFGRYRQKPADPKPRLVVEGVDLAETLNLAQACALARDLVNTPANDMGPVQLEMAAREIAETFGGSISVVAGDDLLTENYPAVHAVGRAADPKRAPRMIEIGWNGAGAETRP